MLYGMDDEDDFKEDFEEFVEEKHINIKKVIIAIVIAVAIVLCIVLAIIVSFKLTSKKVDITVEETNPDVEENIETEYVEADPNKITIQENSSEEISDNSNMEIASHNIEQLVEKKWPIANPNAIEEIRQIYFSDEKQVYLTFDDGPSKDITPQILDILKQYNVKATFFVLGARVELYPDTLKREYEEGHYIANHGYSHIYSKIYTNRDTVFEEYAQTEQCIRNALGEPEFNTYLFRFPGGSSGGYYSRIKSEARDLFNSYGIAFTNWNCLTGDAENKTTKEACFDEMIRTKADQNSIILLMHDANDKTQTVEVLPQIIEYYMNEGYTFKNFYEIFSEREVVINEEENNNG